MLHTDFLKKYYSLQRGVMNDQIISLPFGDIVLNNQDKSAFWNHLFISQIINQQNLLQTETVFVQHQRTPAVYFEKSPELDANTNLLITNKYKEINQDSWMFYHGPPPPQFANTKKVETKDDLKIFLEVFDQCYQKNDPQNVYGELGEYLTVAQKVWLTQHASNHLEYFIVHDDTTPVAVSSLTNYQGLSYISNVGSLRSVRGRGFGKIATLKCVDQSIKNGNTQTCLATEEGTYPNEFYQRLGFKTEFVCPLFKKG